MMDSSSLVPSTKASWWTGGLLLLSFSPQRLLRLGPGTLMLCIQTLAASDWFTTRWLHYVGYLCLIHRPTLNPNLFMFLSGRSQLLSVAPVKDRISTFNAGS